MAALLGWENLQTFVTSAATTNSVMIMGNYAGGHDTGTMGTAGTVSNYYLGGLGTALSGSVTYGNFGTENQYYYGTAQSVFGNIYGIGGTVYGSGGVTFFPQQTLTPEEVEQLNAANAKREQEREAAKGKARKLLMELLQEEQQKQFEKDGSFELEVNGRLYRIRPGSKVERMDKARKQVESLFCIHPKDYELPAEDWAIGQKLLLEASESEFLRIANETRLVA